MKLTDWMEINCLVDADVAARLDVKIDRSTISRVRRGKQHPSPSLIVSIARLTNGQVPPNSFFDVEVETAAE